MTSGGIVATPSQKETRMSEQSEPVQQQPTRRGTANQSAQGDQDVQQRDRVSQQTPPQENDPVTAKNPDNPAF